MNDTPEHIATRYRELLMRRSSAERVAMACDMFDAARTLMRAALSAEPDPRPLRVRLFLRTYGQDFDVQTRERICHWLAERESVVPTIPAPLSPALRP